jgi:transposase
MPTSFLPYQPEQDFLLPPSPREWLPEDHLAYFVSEVIDQLDLAAFYARYEGDGRRNQPYHPAMMAKVLIYAYASGVYSSRKIARRLQEDVAFRVLAAGSTPAHRTLCEFRRVHLSELSALFVQVVHLAQELGLLKLGAIGLDGTKVRANASKHKAMSYGRMGEQQKKLEGEIAALLARAQAVDVQEDRQFGEDSPGESLPQELARRESRLAQIRAAKARLEARQAEADRARGRHEDDDRKPPGNFGRGRRFKRDFGLPEERSQENFTDPDSRIMKTPEGYQQCYNAFAAVDEHSQLIVANALTNNAADSAQLLPLVSASTANTGAPPTQVLADAGFRSEQSLAALEAAGVPALVSLGREGKAIGNIDVSRCPATARMRERLDSPEGRRRYRRRKVIPEPVFGWIKQVLGFRRFSLRGITKVQGEWDLVCMAMNLKRMHSLCA